MYHYQLVLLGDEGRGEFLESLIRQEFKNRLIKQEFFSLIRSTQYSSISYKEELVAVYFSRDYSELEAGEEQLIRELIAHGVPFLPLLPDLEQCGPLLPGLLKRFNAMPESDHAAIARCIMRLFHVDMQERRVFLSYKRSDSKEIAFQLYQKLLVKGYHVFLDSLSLDGGLPFQHHLHEHLNQANLVILLDSPNAHASDWIKEELRHMEQQGHGIVQVLWPSSNPDRPYLICSRHELQDSDFLPPSRYRVSDECLERICDAAENDLIRSLSAKRARIASQLVEKNLLQPGYLDNTVNTVISNGRVIVKPTEQERTYYLIYPGVPDARKLYECVRMLKKQKNSPRKKRSYATVCDMIGLLDDTGEYLKWLGSKVHAPLITVNSGKR